MKLQHNMPLLEHTSLHAGGLAETAIWIEDGDNLIKIIGSAQKPVWVLGYGTNILVSDKGLPGSVLLNQSGAIEVLDNGQIRAQSGANWDKLVQKAISGNLWGLEFTSGVPGGVGAAIAGGIAAYGHQVADCFVKATILNSDDGAIFEWDKTKLQFDYRTSALQKPENKNLVILEATFQLQPHSTGELQYESALKTAARLGIDPSTLENRRQIIMETRKSAGSLLKDLTKGPWTAGSFFRNPIVDEDQVQAIVSHEEAGINREHLLRQNLIHGGNKARVSAAHILLAAGFHRGQSWGKVRLHPNHILKVENVGGATAQEIYEVVRHILQTVEQELGIVLTPEVRFLGEFNS